MDPTKYHGAWILRVDLPGSMTSKFSVDPRSKFRKLPNNLQTLSHALCGLSLSIPDHFHSLSKSSRVHGHTRGRRVKVTREQINLTGLGYSPKTTYGKVQWDVVLLNFKI